MARPQPSLSASPKLQGSSEDSLSRVGAAAVVGRKTRKHSYFRSTENRFTESKMQTGLSIAIPIGALPLDGAH